MINNFTTVAAGTYETYLQDVSIHIHIIFIHNMYIHPYTLLRYIYIYAQKEFVRSLHFCFRDGTIYRVSRAVFFLVLAQHSVHLMCQYIFTTDTAGVTFKSTLDQLLGITRWKSGNRIVQCSAPINQLYKFTLHDIHLTSRDLYGWCISIQTKTHNIIRNRVSLRSFASISIVVYQSRIAMKYITC